MIHYNHSKGVNDIAESKSKAEIQRDYSKRTNYEAQKKYIKAKTKAYTFRFNTIHDADIIECLEGQKSKITYLKTLIRADMENKK